MLKPTDLLKGLNGPKIWKKVNNEKLNEKKENKVRLETINSFQQPSVLKIKEILNFGWKELMSQWSFNAARCPGCKSLDVRKSNFRLLDLLTVWTFRTMARCGECGKRFGTWMVVENGPRKKAGGRKRAPATDSNEEAAPFWA